MKTINKISVILVISALFTGACTKDFLNDVRDENKIPSVDYWNSPEDAFRTIVAAYAVLKYNGITGISNNYVMMALDRNVTNEGGDYAIYESMTFRTDDPRISALYQHLCVGMYRSNLAIENIPKCFEGENEDASAMNKMLGEAHFLRAFFGYSFTTRFNAPPLITKVFADNDDYKRLTNTDQQVWLGTAKNDCLFAISQLPESWDPANTGRATKGAAWFLLGKCYMYAEQWDSAEYAFARLIDEKIGGYELILPQGTDSVDYLYAYLCNYSLKALANGSKVYPAENNQESIFETQEGYEGSTYWNLSLDGYGCDGSKYTDYFSFIGFWNVGVKDAFIAGYEKIDSSATVPLHFDARKYATVYLPGDTIKCWEDGPYCGKEIGSIGKLEKPSWAVGAKSIKKYMFPLYPYTSNNNKTDPNNRRLFSFADALLLAAETKYQLGKDNEALNYINQIRRRIGLPDTNAAGIDLKNILLHEREMEFAMECTYAIDIMRWARTKDQRTGEAYFVDASQLIPGFKKNKNEYFPIPQFEIDNMTLGPGLKQNPGW